MEFPDLGAHCSEPTCKRLDFLPLKCDACEQIFCTDHITYTQHQCTSAYKKDVQVPVCPLCNIPIPVRKGEMPDAVVGEHIDRDCKSDPAQRKRKIFTNKCLKPGCKQREMMKVICDQCHGNFCLKHRHPLDHDCNGVGRPLSRAGHAAVARAQATSSVAAGTSSRGASRPVTRPAAGPLAPASSRGSVMVALPPSSTLSPAVALQNGLSEDEALQQALEMSLAESAPGSARALSSLQEEEDLALARALAASEEEHRRRQQAQSRSSRPSDCSMF
ncbi:AN1-type zinc finger protein 2B isoform X3 [Dermochelys coriacea]|uniref:AN1-type zinc finger protein 2B isoform X3 n=1 Tax=Dermochelys coriacea TaxID=27794 RepID=UPI0018E85EA4|nr:AN1-type zinc finger protein 2B isoform X3 [Dermochelys coriacea]